MTLTLAEFAERETARMRAYLTERDPESISARYVDHALAVCPPELHELIKVRAMLAAYDKRPLCPLTPVVLDLVSDITGVRIDCGWHVAAFGYQIHGRRAVGDKEYRAERMVDGLELQESHVAASIWAHRTIDVIDLVLGYDGNGPLISDRAAQIRRCIGEQIKMQAMQKSGSR